jgi:hypothetical protein
MSPLAIADVLASLEAAGMVVDHYDGERGVASFCPVCVRQMLWHEGLPGFVCESGCSPSRIADEIHFRAVTRGGGYGRGAEANGATDAGLIFDLLTFADLLALPDPEWLIDGLLPSDGLGVLYGPSGSFKSFLALDWALSVATGLPWHGHSVKRPGWVVYIAAEGHSGLPARVRAWWRAHGEPDLSRARWLPLAVNFRERDQVERLRRTLAALPERLRLLVDDTMARSMVGGDENSAKDVGEFIAAVDSTPADLRLVVHHTGHDGSHERGSSALQGAADLRAKVERRGPLMDLTCEKVKDAEEWRPITLRIEPQDGGSCVLSRVAEPDAVAETRERLRGDVLALVHDQAPVSSRKVREGIGGRAGDVDDALEALRSGGLIRRENGKKHGGWEPCPEERDTLGHTPLRHRRGCPCPEGRKRT